MANPAEKQPPEPLTRDEVSELRTMKAELRRLALRLLQLTAKERGEEAEPVDPSIVEPLTADEIVELRIMLERFQVDPAAVKEMIKNVKQRRERREERPRYVYFIRDDAGLIKIGSARDPESRLSSLQTAHANKLVLIGTIRGSQKIERALHERVSAHRAHGEWFRPHEDVIALIDREIEKDRERNK